METPEEVRRRVRREKQLASRLQLATTRLETAQQERIWAIAAAYAAGLSIRKIAAATGLSPSCVHQLLSNEEAREILGWLSPLHEQGLASEEDPWSIGIRFYLPCRSAWPRRWKSYVDASNGLSG